LNVLFELFPTDMLICEFRAVHKKRPQSEGRGSLSSAEKGGGGQFFSDVFYGRPQPLIYFLRTQNQGRISLIVNRDLGNPKNALFLSFEHVLQLQN